jgi:hypothetical protein
VDDLRLGEPPDEAAELLAQHVTIKPAYPAVPWSRELAYV